MMKQGCQFGGRFTQALAIDFASSPQWSGSRFKNLASISDSSGFESLPRFLYKQFCEKNEREPSRPLEVLAFDQKEFSKASNDFCFTWFGHSALLLSLDQKTILIDPMLGGNAAPISPIPIRRYSRDTIEIIDGLPPIDCVLISHDHYDHLDRQSIRALDAKVGRFLVPLGVARHLREWGIAADRIQGLDWWQEVKIDDLAFTLTPTQHFSGRGLNDRAKSLWGGWAIVGEKTKVWFSGDGGYGAHFKEIGRRLGPFDFAFMECGQYNENWHSMHMYPEESVLAALDVGVKTVMPVHWGAFSLAQHSWYEPVERFLAEAELLGQACIVPRLGELVSSPDSVAARRWWREYLESPQESRLSRKGRKWASSQ